MKIGRFGKLLRTIYTDELYIRRYTEKLNDDYSTSMELQDIDTFESIPCRISFEKPDLAETDRYDYNNIEVQIKIFCDYNIDIRKGDFVKVVRIQDEDKAEIEVYEGIAGLPYRFSTHQEFRILKKGVG